MNVGRNAPFVLDPDKVELIGKLPHPLCGILIVLRLFRDPCIISALGGFNLTRLGCICIIHFLLRRDLARIAHTLNDEFLIVLDLRSNLILLHVLRTNMMIY